jgi:hypothetical protein
LEGWSAGIPKGIISLGNGSYKNRSIHKGITTVVE